MRGSKFARVILAMALFSTNLAQAGWFDNAEKEENQRNRGGRRGGAPEGPDYDPGFAEAYNQQNQQGGGDPNDRANMRREQLREMRRKKAPRDREEMMTKEFNESILRDDQVEETHTPEENLDGYLTDEDINRIWSEHMHDFVPEDMMNAIVEAKSTEALFEYIGHETPTKIKGAYYVLGGNKEKTISCIVYDPNREILYKRKGSAQGILLFDTTVPGEYAIIFSNSVSGQDLTVTLALHTYETQEEQIKYDILSDGSRVQIEGPGMNDGSAAAAGGSEMDEQAKIDALGGADNMAATDNEVQNVRTMLREIQVQTKQIQSEAKLSMMRQNGHNADLLLNQDWNFYFMLLEVVCFGAIVAFQTHHIKKLLDNKLII